VRRIYGDKVRLVWKNKPLPFHDNAEPAAEAALAAAEQGRFWPYHDLLFKNQETLDPASLEHFAQRAGLDLDRFRAAIRSHKFSARIEADAVAGAKLGVQGTPCSFINGKYFSGARPLAEYRAMIDAELKVAKPYDELMQTALAELPTMPNANAAAPAAEPRREPGGGDVGPTYTRGSDKAPITLVEYADYFCEYCRSAEPPLLRILDEYAGKVRVVWKDFPLSLEDDGTVAARAALAAGEQGKFWEMHAKLMSEPTRERRSIEAYAHELRLDLARFRADFDSKKYDSIFSSNIAVANSIARPPVGVPTVFVAGKQLEAGVTFEALKKAVDEELDRRHLAAR